MTGFANSSTALDIGNEKQIEISLNIRSVNSRFFDASVRAPHALSGIEADSIKLLRKRLKRGTIHVTIHLNNLGSLVQEITPSIELAKVYLAAAEQLKEACNLTGELSLTDVMRLPDIVAKKEFRIAGEHKKFIIDLVDKTCTKLLEERNKEGVQLANDISERTDKLAQMIEDIAKQIDQIFKQRQQAVIDKSKELANDHDHENQQCDKLRSTMQVYLDKLDVTEEIVRFRSHIVSFKSILADDSQQKGKKLDFTTQELFRESNTIASKCGHGITSSTIIAMKSELEKIREQLQNIV